MIPFVLKICIDLYLIFVFVFIVGFTNSQKLVLLCNFIHVPTINKALNRNHVTIFLSEINLSFIQIEIAQPDVHFCKHFYFHFARTHRLSVSL